MNKVKKYMVVGAGRTGLSAVRYLQQHHRVLLFDDDENAHGFAVIKQELPAVDTLAADFSKVPWQDIAAVVVSPGVAPCHPLLKEAKACGIQVQSDIEIFASVIQSPVVAITGTNGKSTVTTLVAHLLQAMGKKVLLGGNLGTPVLDLLALPEPDYFVLELSSFQLELTTTMAVEVGVLLNIAEDHLDRHASFDAYVAAKRKLYTWSQQAVYNKDDASTLPPPSMPAISFSASNPDAQQLGLTKSQDGSNKLVYDNTRLISVDKLPLVGKHNWMNMLAALGVGERLGLDISFMAHALSDYQGLPHRCEAVRRHSDVLWLNDSKGTNVAASMAAIQGTQESIKGKLIWLAGGLAKGQSFQAMSKLCANMRHVILFGEDAPMIGDAVRGHADMTYTATLAEAVKLADEIACAGDAVLLSPACSSFDMFCHYAERGETFKQLVSSLR